MPSDKPKAKRRPIIKAPANPKFDVYIPAPARPGEQEFVRSFGHLSGRSEGATDFFDLKKLRSVKGKKHAYRDKPPGVGAGQASVGAGGLVEESGRTFQKKFTGKPAAFFDIEIDKPGFKGRMKKLRRIAHKRGLIGILPGALATYKAAKEKK